MPYRDLKHQNHRLLKPPKTINMLQWFRHLSNCSEKTTNVSVTAMKNFNVSVTVVKNYKLFSNCGENLPTFQ